MNMTDITNNSARHRYEMIVDGHTAFAEYELAPGIIEFTHTVVPKELGGRGLGSKIASFVLGDAKARGLKVKATCPFIAAYLQKHPDAATTV
jgi:predicted GNAT family acetyltransferase